MYIYPLNGVFIGLKAYFYDELLFCYFLINDKNKVIFFKIERFC